MRIVKPFLHKIRAACARIKMRAYRNRHTILQNRIKIKNVILNAVKNLKYKEITVSRDFSASPQNDNGADALIRPYLHCYAVKNSAGITFSTKSSIYATLKSACLMRAACFLARVSEYCDSG